MVHCYQHGWDSDEDVIMDVWTFKNKIKGYENIVYHVLFYGYIRCPEKTVMIVCNPALWGIFRRFVKTKDLDKEVQRQIIDDCKQFIRGLIYLSTFSKPYGFKDLKENVEDYIKFKNNFADNVCNQICLIINRPYLFDFYKEQLFGIYKDGDKYSDKYDPLKDGEDLFFKQDIKKYKPRYNDVEVDLELPKDYLNILQSYHNKIQNYKFIIFKVLFQALISEKGTFKQAYHSIIWDTFKNNPNTMFLQWNIKKDIIDSSKEFVKILLQLSNLSKEDFRLYHDNQYADYNAYKYEISTRVCKKLIQDYPQVFLNADTDENKAMEMLKLNIFGRTKDGKDLY